MDTKFIMTASSIILGAAALTFTFIPEEILKLLHTEVNKPFILLLQILGALYFGFAMLNWMSRSSIIGGIYNKPTAIANFAHFFIGAMALVKGLLSNNEMPSQLWIVAVIYLFFAVTFGWMFYNNPAGKKQYD